MAMKPKKWLIDNGHMSADKINQRGRLSRENVALIEAAVRNGADIEGYTSVTSKPTADSDKPAEVKVERATATGERIIDVPNPIRPEDSWSAHTFIDGKKVAVGMKTVDQGCGNSLTYCACRNASAYVGIHQDICLITFTPKGN